MTPKAELLKLLRGNRFTATEITMIKILWKINGIDAALKAAKKWPK